MKVTFYHLEQLYKKGYSLDLIFLLKMINEDEDTGVLCESHIKLEVLRLTLITKGLLTPAFKATKTGQELLEWFSVENKDGGEVKLIRKKKNSTNFDKWWAAFPSTDTFTYKGLAFEGTRSLKAKKEDCKTKLDAILNEGEFTIEEMVKAIEFEALQKKENSFKTKVNKLSFMQNSLTYLNQRTFESFIELIREGVVLETKINYDGVNL